MPNGWQKAQTNKGEIYFINHNTRTTCWEDPRLPLVPNYLKQQQYNNGVSNVSSANSSNSASPLLMLNTNQANSTQSVSSFSNNSSNSINFNTQNSQAFNEENPEQFDTDKIKSIIIDIINQKNELLKTLEDLNKKVCLIF